MSSERDWEGEMKRFGLDDDTADRLLSGQVVPQDAPPGYQAVAEAILAARVSTPVDTSREVATVAAAVEALRSGSQTPTPVRRQRMLARLFTAKVAAIATVTVLGATAAAAATSELPDSAQGFVSSAAAHVGLKVPKPHTHAGANNAATPGNGAAVGPDASGPAKFGLCTAFAAGKATTNPHSHKSKSVAFRNLQAAATDAGMSVADYCSSATPPSTTTTTTTTATTTTTVPGTSETSPSGNGSSGHGGPPVSTPVGPPVSTPVGPPVSTPVGPPVSTPVGHPPVSTPVGPPVSSQGHPPVSTPVGPPASAHGTPPQS